MELWHATVSGKTPFSLEVPSDRDLWVLRAALVNTETGPNVLSYSTGPQDVVLGTLRYEHTEQFKLDMCVTADSGIQFSVKGPGEVQLSGHYELYSEDPSYDYFDGEPSDEDEDEDEEEDMVVQELVAKKKAGKQATKGENKEWVVAPEAKATQGNGWFGRTHRTSKDHAGDAR